MERRPVERLKQGTVRGLKRRPVEVLERGGRGGLERGGEGGLGGYCREGLGGQVKLESGVVVVDWMSPPSPSDSMAESSIKRDLGLVGG